MATTETTTAKMTTRTGATAMLVMKVTAAKTEEELGSDDDGDRRYRALCLYVAVWLLVDFRIWYE